MKNLGRKPDYRLSAMNKDTDEKGRVGAAWKNEDGTISVVLDPFITLTSSKDLILNLFPEKQPKQSSK
jgi:hypothetical protein